MSQRMTKPSKWHVHPAKTDQPGHPPTLIRVFTVRMTKAWVLSYPLGTQQRLWSDWADAQSDLGLRWAHINFVGFVVLSLKLWSCIGAETVSLTWCLKNNNFVCHIVVCFHVWIHLSFCEHVSLNHVWIHLSFCEHVSLNHVWIHLPFCEHVSLNHVWIHLFFLWTCVMKPSSTKFSTCNTHPVHDKILQSFCYLTYTNIFHLCFSTLN